MVYEKILTNLQSLRVLKQSSYRLLGLFQPGEKTGNNKKLTNYYENRIKSWKLKNS